MLKNIKASLDEICPLKIFKIKKFKEPWVSQELLEIIKDKDILLKKAKKTKLPEDWKIAKRARNDCLTKVRRAKASFITTELGTNKNDSKKIWKNIKDILPLGNKSNKIIRLSNLDTDEEIPEVDTANYINTFFANVGQNLAAKFTMPWLFDGVVNNNKSEDIVADNDEILKLCKEIDVNKSSCIEDVSCKVMKHALIYLNLHQLCCICKLKDRRILHLASYMFKQKGNEHIVNSREVRTRAHDAILFVTVKPNNEKYKRNVFYKGALIWNALPEVERNIEKYENFKCAQKKKMIENLNAQQICF